MLASSGEEMLELGDDCVLEPEDDDGDEDYEPSEGSYENSGESYEDEDESFDENQEDHEDEDDGSYEDYDEALEHEDYEHSDKNHKDHEDDSSSPLTEISDEHESLGASSHGRDLDVSMDLGSALHEDARPARPTSTRPQISIGVSHTFPYGCATPERVRSPPCLDKQGPEHDDLQLMQDDTQVKQDYVGRHDFGANEDHDDEDSDADADADGISDDGEWVAADT